MPVIFIRFEDLVLDKKKYITQAFKLILGYESLEGMYIEKRIE